MMKVPVYNTENGEKTGEMNLPEKIAQVNVSIPLLHEVVTAYLSNQRKGTASAKVRSEVRGGGRKPWRQKGTGRARAGSIRSPLWRKGGVVFGPRPRSFRIDLPVKKLHQALLMALHSKVDADRVIAVKDMVIPEPKTKKLKVILDKLKLSGKILVVVKKIDNNLRLAVRNLTDVVVISLDSINTYEILNAHKIIFTEEAMSCL